MDKTVIDKKNISEKYLICPECHGNLDFTDYKCLKCNFKFKQTNDIYILLPVALEINKLNEDKKWENKEFREKKDNPACFSLVAKGDDIFYFYEQILPNYKFKGAVLEIGAGTCWMSSLIKFTNPGVESIATDVSLNALLKGKEIDKIIGGGIDCFAVCDAEKLPLEDESFDVVIGGSIVHHFFNPKKGVKEIYRVLKKGGYYLSILELEANRMLGYIWSRIGTAGEVAGKWGIKENVYSFKQYSDFFKSAGFQEIKFFFERAPEYKNHHWFLAPYYKIMSYFPDWVVKLIGSSIGFLAYK